MQIPVRVALPEQEDEDDDGDRRILNQTIQFIMPTEQLFLMLRGISVALWIIAAAIVGIALKL